LVGLTATSFDRGPTGIVFTTENSWALAVFIPEENIGDKSNIITKSEKEMIETGFKIFLAFTITIIVIILRFYHFFHMTEYTIYNLSIFNASLI
jgi:hypothetical protein